MKDTSTIFSVPLVEGSDVFLEIRWDNRTKEKRCLYAECRSTGARAITKHMPTASAVQTLVDALPLGIKSFAAACSFLLSKGHKLEHLKACEPYGK